MDWTPLWEALSENALAVLWALTLVYLVPYIKAKVESIKDSRVRQIVSTLVEAAEQKFVSGTGAAKYQWVIEQASRRGLKIDEADVEAAVLRLTGGAATAGGGEQ